MIRLRSFLPKQAYSTANEIVSLLYASLADCSFMGSDYLVLFVFPPVFSRQEPERPCVMDAKAGGSVVLLSGPSINWCP